MINNSWGSTPIFARSQNLAVARSFDRQTVDQYEQISETGRDGLGTVVVQSAGNDHLNANGDGINASRFTITVAAARDDGFTSSYSNYGACVLVTAPAGDRAEEGGRGIVTTDLLGREGYNLRLDPHGRQDYTDDFGGTSAAAPIVTGVVALMLDANPELGWRDVQNILSLSATHTGSEIGGGISGFETSPWLVNGAANWNGGGMHYSQDYGYGMVDAYNAVRMAEAWSLFAPAQTSANEESVTTSVEVDQPIEDLSTLEFQFTVDDSDLTIEHVELTLTLTHSAILDLNVYPDLAGRHRDDDLGPDHRAADGGGEHAHLDFWDRRAARRARRGRLDGARRGRGGGEFGNARIRSPSPPMAARPASTASTTTPTNFPTWWRSMRRAPRSRTPTAASTGSTFRPWRAASRSTLRQARPPAPGSSSRPAP